MQVRSPIATFGLLTTLVCCSGSTGTETKVPQSAESAAQVERPQEVAEDIEPYESILTVRVSDAFARKMMRDRLGAKKSARSQVELFQRATRRQVTIWIKGQLGVERMRVAAVAGG